MVRVAIMSSPRKKHVRPTPLDSFIADGADVLARRGSPLREKDPDMASSAEKAASAAARLKAKGRHKSKAKDDSAPKA